jgi:dTMP kinase
MNGILITFEGPDGSGKSTQAKIFEQWLANQGIKTKLTREPGGTPLAERIRGVLLEPSAEEVDPMTELLLYAAARAQHVSSLIQPELQSGTVVVCERFVDSTVAYQGFGLGYDLETIGRVNAIATQGIRPDWTVLIDVEPEVAAERMGRRGVKDRIEARGLAFQRRVREGYLALAKDDPQRVQIFSAGHTSVAQVQNRIRQAFLQRYPNVKGGKGGR